MKKRGTALTAICAPLLACLLLTGCASANAVQAEEPVLEASEAAYEPQEAISGETSDAKDDSAPEVPGEPGPPLETDESAECGDSEGGYESQEAAGDYVEPDYGYEEPAYDYADYDYAEPTYDYAEPTYDYGTSIYVAEYNELYNDDGPTHDMPGWHDGYLETYFDASSHFMAGEWTVDDEGFYHDENGRYVIGVDVSHIDEMPYGTVVETGLGEAVVYDYGSGAEVHDFAVAGTVNR